MKYDVNYFLDKFSKIPESLWLNGVYSDGEAACAYGHCHGSTLEAEMLEKLLMRLPNLTANENARFPPYEGTPARINNGEIVEYQQETPKQRILAALRDIKAMQETRVDITSELAVLPPDEKADTVSKVESEINSL